METAGSTCPLCQVGVPAGQVHQCGNDVRGMRVDCTGPRVVWSGWDYREWQDINGPLLFSRRPGVH